MHNCYSRGFREASSSWKETVAKKRRAKRPETRGLGRPSLDYRKVGVTLETLLRYHRTPQHFGVGADEGGEAADYLNFHRVVGRVDDNHPVDQLAERRDRLGVGLRCHPPRYNSLTTGDATACLTYWQGYVILMVRVQSIIGATEKRRAVARSMLMIAEISQGRGNCQCSRRNIDRTGSSLVSDTPASCYQLTRRTAVLMDDFWLTMLGRPPRDQAQQNLAERAHAMAE